MVTLNDIEAAERLLGIAYTPEERAQMHDNIEGQILMAKARRAVPLGNDVPPASRFDPRLPTTPMPPPGTTLRLPERPAAPLPASDDDIAFAPAVQLAQWIAAGVLTSRRLTEIYLARIERLGPTLACFATVTADLARAEADAADALLANGVHLGPLHGLPYGLKDLVDTKGIVTGWGAEPMRERVPQADATIVKRLRAAGAVLIGKTTLGALAYGDIWYGGRTLNPWNLNEGSSGSSAGSASATAAGLCAFSIGTETLGSITSPSARCGTTGLRPTFGRVSRHGAMALCPSLDKIGPICRGVEDTAMVLSVINGFDLADRGSIEAGLHIDLSRPLAGLRVGVLREAYDDPAALDLDRATLEAVRRLGVEIVEVSLRDLPYAALVSVLQAEAGAIFEELTLSGADDTLTWQEPAAWPNSFRKARFLSAVDHVQLDRLRYQAMLAMDEAFQSVDLMIGPQMTGPMLVLTNFTGHPCLHLRVGYVESGSRNQMGIGTRRMPVLPPDPDGRVFRVPHGVSIWGRLFEEGPVLQLGLALQDALGVAADRPTFAR